MTEITDILLPTDFSTRNQPAVDMAAELARRFDAAVDVVHAWKPPVDFYEMAGWLDADLGSGHEPEFQAYAEGVQAHCLRQLQGVLHGLDSQGVRARGRLELGQPSQVLLRLANDEHYDLIIMASHGRTGLANVLLGSCAERVVRKSPIPVMVVPVSREHLRDAPEHAADIEYGSSWVSAEAR